MRTTDKFVRVTHRVSLALWGTYDDRMRDDSGDREFVPRELTIEWARAGESDWMLGECTVHGPAVLKKDGRLGVKDMKRNLFYWRLIDEAPDWVVALVKEHHP